jgi:hypothetical protein
MFSRLIPAVCLCLLTLPAWSQTADAAAGEPQSPQAEEAAPEKILVVGQRPGPGLWKISKGDHVLWVFGSYSPLPKNMEWRSHQVETIVAQSQEYLLSPSATAKIGFFSKLALLPHAIGARKNPDGGTLRDVLPADVYERWLPLKKKYLENSDDFERERPIFVADRLYRSGLMHAGLSNGHEVGKAIDAIVKKHKIKTTKSEVELVMDDPVKMVKEFKKSSLDDAACFSKTLERLESDIDAMRVRADAWAKGDIEAIQKLNFADREQACKTAITNSTVFQGRPGLQSMEARMREAWLAAAEKSLANNMSTFAVLRLQSILDPNGMIEALRAKGYQVDSPD